MTPDVSVILPYHNEGELLTRALDSIAAQPFDGDLEVVVVDDASSVPPPIPAQFRFPIVSVRSEQSRFAPGARNLGVQRSRGRYVCFLDSDDEWAPDRLTAHLEFALQNPTAVMIGGSHFVVRDRTWLQVPELIENHYPTLAEQTGILPDSARHDICLQYSFHTAGMLLRRDVFEKVHGFDESYRWGEEWDLQVRIAQIGPIGYVPQPTVRYVAREGSICTTLNAAKFESAARMFRLWRRTVRGLPPGHRRQLRASEREQWLLAAQTQLEHHRRPAQGVKCAIQSLRCRPSVWGLRSALRCALAQVVPNRSAGV